MRYFDIAKKIPKKKYERLISFIMNTIIGLTIILLVGFLARNDYLDDTSNRLILLIMIFVIATIVIFIDYLIIRNKTKGVLARHDIMKYSLVNYMIALLFITIFGVIIFNL